MAVERGRAGRILLVAGGLLLAYAAARVLLPLLTVLAAAAAAAAAVHPFYARLLARRPRRPNAASAAVTAAVCVAVALPLAAGAGILIRESVHAYPILKGRVQALSGPAESIPSWVPGRVRDSLQGLDLGNLLLQNIRGIGAWLGQAASAAAGNAIAMTLNVLVFVLCLFLFLRDGRELAGRLTAAVPLDDAAKAGILARTHDMIIATIQGVFAVAAVQGLLSIAGFALFGVRFPVLLGTLCMLLSPIPFVGTALVWIPVVALVALEGHPGRAALVALWFALVVGTSDNVLRPLLVGSRSRLPAAVVVVGVLGGVQAFGVAGTFLGPLILAIAAAVVDEALLSPGVSPE